MIAGLPAWLWLLGVFGVWAAVALIACVFTHGAKKARGEEQ